MKKIRFQPSVPVEIRAIAQPVALDILKALHRYAATGRGRVKPLAGEFQGLLRLRVGDCRILFDETEDPLSSTTYAAAKRRIDNNRRRRRRDLTAQTQCSSAASTSPQSALSAAVRPSSDAR